MSAYTYPIQEENNISLEASIGTIILHSLLLLAFFFLYLSSETKLEDEQKKDEQLIALQLLSSGGGKGMEGVVTQPDQEGSRADNIGFSAAAPAASSSNSASKPAGAKPTASSGKDNILNSDADEESPVIKGGNSAKNKPKVSDNKSNTTRPAKNNNNTSTAASNNTSNKPQQIDSRSLFSSRNGQNTAGNGNGNSNSDVDAAMRGGGTSNQGGGIGANNRPSGGTGSDYYSGKGVKVALGGRKLVSIPNINDNSQVEGIVNVLIKVDRSGKVLSAEYVTKGSSKSAAVLKDKALDAARKAKFTPLADAPEVQTGTITFTFMVQ